MSDETWTDDMPEVVSDDPEDDDPTPDPDAEPEGGLEEE